MCELRRQCTVGHSVLANGADRVLPPAHSPELCGCGVAGEGSAAAEADRKKSRIHMNVSVGNIVTAPHVQHRHCDHALHRRRRRRRSTLLSDVSVALAHPRQLFMFYLEGDGMEASYDDGEQ